jgi:pilus assembly protein Flp/PilA
MRTFALHRPLGEYLMKNLFARFAKDESGATAIEYGLIAALISIAIIGAARLLGTQLAATFETIRAALASV